MLYYVPKRTQYLHMSHVFSQTYNQENLRSANQLALILTWIVILSNFMIRILSVFVSWFYIFFIFKQAMRIFKLQYLITVILITHLKIETYVKPSNEENVFNFKFDKRPFYSYIEATTYNLFRTPIFHVVRLQNVHVFIFTNPHKYYCSAYLIFWQISILRV